MNHKHLCMIFGIVPGVCSKVIRVMLQLAVRRLADNPIAEVRFPSAEKMRQFAGMVQSREPLVDDVIVIGFMDGVSIPAECTDERFEQNTFYCGYDCDTMVNNVFAYGPDEKVFFEAVNFPGSWADGALTTRFLHTINKKKVSTRYVWIRASPGSEKRMECSSALSPKELPDVFIKTSLIHNYCTELVGFNQINTVFDSEYVRIHNLELEGYDRIAQYYFRPGEYNSDNNDDGNSDGSDEEM